MINLVAQAQAQAKTQDEKARMRSAAVAIDFYNGRQYEHMQTVAAYLYPQTWQDIAKYISCSDLTKGVINQKSILFASPPEVELDTENEALKLKYKEILEQAEFHKRLIATDRMAELTGKVGLTLHWHSVDKRVVIDILTPDKTVVIADEQDPTKAAIVYFMIGNDTDPRLATPLNIYGKWTAESYSVVELNSNFKEVKTVKPPIKNIYGEIPVVWFSPDIEVDSFWVDRGYPLIEGNINVNLRESNLDLALDHQSFSTMVTLGLGSTKDVITGVTRRLDLPSDELSKVPPSAYYITPDAKLAEVAGIIQNKKISIAKEGGLSADAFNQDASNISSGYQLRLTQQQNEENNELKKVIYRPGIMKFLRFMAQCYSAENDTVRIPDDTGIYFNYMSRPGLQNPQEQATLQILKINAGLMSQADALRENNPDLTQEEAIEEVKRIKKEQQEINGGIKPMTDEDLGGEPNVIS